MNRNRSRPREGWTLYDGGCDFRCPFRIVLSSLFEGGLRRKGVLVGTSLVSDKEES